MGSFPVNPAPIALTHDPNGSDSQLLPVIIDIHRRAGRQPLKTVTAIFNLMLEDCLDKLPKAERPK